MCRCSELNCSVPKQLLPSGFCYPQLSNSSMVSFEDPFEFVLSALSVSFYSPPPVSSFSASLPPLRQCLLTCKAFFFCFSQHRSLSSFSPLSSLSFTPTPRLVSPLSSSDSLLSIFQQAYVGLSASLSLSLFQEDVHTVCPFPVSFAPPFTSFYYLSLSSFI